MSCRRVSNISARLVPPPQPVGYAIDLRRCLSATPSTPIDAVDGIVDRSAFLSAA